MSARRTLPFLVAAALAAVAASSCDCGGLVPEANAGEQEPYATDALVGIPAEGDGVAVTAPEVAASLQPIDEGTPGRIGSACETVDDCGGGTCLLGAFARGTCSQACEATCPLDQGAREGVCALRDQLPDDASVLASGGACLSTCDYGRFPEDGCREGYGCVPLDRRGRGGGLAYACMPGVPVAKSSCMEELVARGASFAPLAKQHDDTPRFLEGARCNIEDAVLLHTPVHGVVFRNGDGKETPSIIASCAMAVALVEAVDVWKAQGVAKVVHFGTYSCRKIAGKPRLSRHAGGDAIDVGGFVMNDGRTVSVVRDWRKGDAGKLLTDVVANAKAQGPWSTLITPDDNWDHHDHLHLDIKGSPSVAGRIKLLAKD